MEGALARMEAIGAALPASDGVASFNRMYLGVTRGVEAGLGAGTFADPAWMTRLDVEFANLYFAAVDAAGSDAPLPRAWEPLVAARSHPGIEPIQFALAGMNAHIDHDLPLAVVATCRELGTTPSEGTHHQDYQRVDALLDAAEQSVRQSFESGPGLALDHHLRAVADLVGNTTINSARALAWDSALALWDLRDHRRGTDLYLDGLADAVAAASRLLLVALP